MLIKPRQPESLVVGSFRNEMTNVYMISNLLPGAKVMLVIVLMVALKQNFCCQFASSRLKFMCDIGSTFDKDCLHIKPFLMFDNIDSTVT